MGNLLSVLRDNSNARDDFRELDWRELDWFVHVFPLAR